MRQGMISGRGVGLAFAVLLTLAAACTPEAFYNNISSLGGTTPGGRSNVGVSFINNTPFRAIFTFGTYDPQNPDFLPQFRQFFVSANASNRLEGNSSSSVISLRCGRAFTVGGQELIDRIRENNLDENANEEALIAGIAFSDRPLDDPDAGQPTAGTDQGITTLQGVEFSCDALLVYTLELDDTQPDGFRIDLDVVEPEE